MHPEEIERDIGIYNSDKDGDQDGNGDGKGKGKVVTDPLTDDLDSPWVSLRQDEALRAEIWQDVERCMPDNDYFRLPSTQRMLLDVLFIFCKLNQDISYRQGMHELLAPIVWVVEQDAIEPSSLKRHRASDGNEGLLQSILDAEYIEHDVFTLFSLIMQTAKSFYELGSGPSEGRMSINGTQQSSSPIIDRSQRIHQDYLNRVDPELAEHLTNIDILPQIFLIRWIRLLFGREFPFEDLLPLWDALLAADPGLSLVDFICVAMLLRVRWQLLEADYSSALTILLRYPSSSHPPSTFVQDALYLKNNLTVEGGNHIISKYSGRTPSSRRKGGRSRPWKSKGKDVLHSSSSSKSSDIRRKSPMGSPTRYIRRQGIDVLLQDAAKAVYQRGEKWGVNKAVREAVDEMKKNMQGLQQLQSGALSPRGEKGNDNNLRWSLDEGGYISPTSSALPPTGKEIEGEVEKLHRRNRALAKILGLALEELKNTNDDNDDEKKTFPSEDLETLLKTIDFVRNRLENSSLSIIEEKENKEGPSMKTPPNDSEFPIETQSVIPTKSTFQQTDSTPRTPPPKTTEPIIPPSTPTPTTRNPSTTINEEDTTTSTESSRYQTPDNSTRHSSKPSLSDHHDNQTPTRPSLANSPFSWILGGGGSESDQESSHKNNNNNYNKDWRAAQFFNTASFTTPATERKTGGKAPGFLFGDESDDDGDAGGGLGKGRKGGGKKWDRDGDGDGDGEGGNSFNLASLRRGKGRGDV
ncbi:MAG: hypothetical protein M1823_003176 [Watsoniomyces obsoletus]|nr:MAG: hypothetical protein M1823_003176 [Watsoniomyces obsoletus]